jgi:anti-sigma factor RsiW
MMHFSEAELVEVVEGELDAARATHLETCAACRDRAASVRAALRAATSVTMPEPSPLFWDHLSARIRHGIAAEPPVGRLWSRPRVVAALGCAAAILIGVGLSVRGLPRQQVAPQIVKSAPAPSASPTTIVKPPIEAPATDAAWALLRDAASEMQLDDANEAGLSVRPGAIDSAVLDLTPPERDALGRLLQDAINAGGASRKAL